jgi:hypothetical protein
MNKKEMQQQKGFRIPRAYINSGGGSILQEHTIHQIPISGLSGQDIDGAVSTSRCVFVLCNTLTNGNIILFSIPSVYSG